MIKSSQSYALHYGASLSRSISRVTKFVAVIAILALSSGSVMAQGVTSSGTDYWVGFMPNYIGGRNVTQLFLASGTNNTVKVTVGGSVKAYTLTPNQGITADLSGAGVTRIPETPSYSAVHVTSSAPLTMYGYNVWDGGAGFIGGSPDGYLAIPTSALGTLYYTVNYYDANFGGLATVGEFLVIAPQDFTTVTIRTTSHTMSPSGGISHIPGDTWSFQLMKGQSYLVQSSGQFLGSDDLTGTKVTSDKPIALISGHQISPITVDMSSADHLCEMVPPVDKWGTQYFDMPMAGRIKCGDYIRVISGEDNNQVTYNGMGPFLLNAGDWAEVPENTVAMVFTSIVHKKFIVAQYSYSLGFDGDPSTNADPFMILFTPQENFEKRMIFRSPLSAKNGTFINYLTVISNKDSLLKIQINGKSLGAYNAVGRQDFPGTNPLMSAIRVQLPNGSNTFLATGSTPFGMYQYGFAYYEGYGWPTGEALNVQSPDTLPPLQTFNQVCGSYNVHLMEDRLMPAFSFTDTRIAEVDFITEANDPRWGKPSYNYLFTLDPNFNPGDSTANFTLSVINPLQDAYGAVFTVDKAGNDTVYEYTYTAPKLSFSPSPYYAYGNVLVNGDSCKTITVTNNSANDVLLRSADILGIAKHGAYTLTPSNFNATLHAGGTTQFTICFSPSDTGAANMAIDSLTLGIGTCDSVRFGLNGQGVTPLIYANDLNFGVVDSGKTKCMDLVITNKGTATLTITKQNLPNTTDFTVSANQSFPIYLAPGKSITLQACFHPTHTGSFITTDLFGTLNPSQFLHSIKDTSQLIGVAQTNGALLTSYQEASAASCNQKPLIVDTVYDPEPVSININSASITGPDASSFSIVGFSPAGSPPSQGTYPYPLGAAPAPGYEYTIMFDPTVKGMLSGVRTAKLNIYPEGKPPLIASLSADSKEPILVTVPTNGTTINLGTTLINQGLSSTVTIQNTGNDVLDVAQLTIAGTDPTYFTVTPQGPFTIQPGGTQTVTINFLAGATAKTYSATLNVVPAGTSPCATGSGIPLLAVASSSGYDGTGAAYNTTFTCKNQDLSGSFINRSSPNSKDTLWLESVVVTGANASDFQQVPALAPMPMPVAPQQTIQVPVRFSPTATGARSAQLLFTFTDSTNVANTLTEPLTGTGASITEVIGVGTTTGSTYTGHVRDAIQVPIVISQSMAAAGTNEVYGYDFTVSFHEDAFDFTPSSIQAPAGVTIAMVGTPTVNPATHIVTYEFKGTSSAALSNLTTLATLPLMVVLDTALGTAITVGPVTFYDQAGQSVCYIASSNVNGAFTFQPNCGDVTIQNLLKGSTTALSIKPSEPNPFTSTTSIGFSVNEAGAAVTMYIYDELGHIVATLLENQPMKAGSYSVTLDGSKMAAGSYFARITDGTNTATQRLILSK